MYKVKVKAHVHVVACVSKYTTHPKSNLVMAVSLHRVLISDSVDASCRGILEEGGVTVDYRPGLSKEDLLACIKVTSFLFVCCNDTYSACVYVCVCVRTTMGS